MKLLNEQIILGVLREEWNKRVKSLIIESDDTPIKASGVDKLLSPELKLIHKKSKLKYTIDSIGARQVILRNPEGETFVVSSDSLENEYSID
jgi:hypothetical protein